MPNSANLEFIAGRNSQIELKPGLLRVARKSCAKVLVRNARTVRRVCQNRAQNNQIQLPVTESEWGHGILILVT